MYVYYYYINFYILYANDLIFWCLGSENFWAKQMKLLKMYNIS